MCVLFSRSAFITMPKRRAGPGPGDYEKWMEFQAKFAQMQQEMDKLPSLFTRSPYTSDDEASDSSDSSNKENGDKEGIS